MYLTVSKRFEISFSHRMHLPHLNEAENNRLFGDESKGEFGHGHNTVVTFIFHGPVDKSNGMMINVSTIKERLNPLLASRYDHKFLNADTKPFDGIVPTFEHIARELLQDAVPLFADESSDAVVCHICDDERFEAIAYTDGTIERSYFTDFSAARRTCSPNLSDDENSRLFGVSSRKSGHGHHYRLRFTFDQPVNPESGLVVEDEKINSILHDLFEKFDHRNMNIDIPEFDGQPITTESMAKFFYEYVNKRIPLNRMRLSENDYFFVEYNKRNEMYLGVKDIFHAAHRLHTDAITEAENIELYGKCNNLHGHGHTYKAEMVLTGSYNEQSGALHDLGKVLSGFRAVLDDWDYKHLNNETEDFNGLLTTGENISSVLWKKLENLFGNDLHRLSLWETANNRFTLRRKL